MRATYDLKLKLSLINLSNEQNKYLTILETLCMYFTMKRELCFIQFTKACVCVCKSRLMKESVADPLNLQFN